jgi:thiosulfate/3-mercaptopyruvate sulfurtransferase
MLTLIALAAMAYPRPELLVDTAWVAAHAADASVRIVDMRRSGYAEGHVPGAVHLDPDAIREADRPPTFLPTPAEFEALMGRLGISNTTHVVVYDERGGIYAARLWWILAYFGHAPGPSGVSLVNGGWIQWTAEGRETTTAVPAVPPGRFRAMGQPHWIATAADVQAAIGASGAVILDARTQDEIAGKDLRNIRRGGFIPSSRPLYWEDLLDPVAKTFKPAEALKAMFDARGITESTDVIAYCQVGMRASVDLFALRLMGHSHLRNYYGAWEEWGNRDDLPLGKK